MCQSDCHGPQKEAEVNPVLEGFRKLSVSRFLEELDAQGFVWIAKRLSGNDTGLKGGHQAGVYFPRGFFERALPELHTTAEFNPVQRISECYFPADDCLSTGLTARYYNSKFFPERNLAKPYDEYRITSWGGSSSPVQDRENTGASFVFGLIRKDGVYIAVAWVAANVAEEDEIDSWLGEELEPARCIMGIGSCRPAAARQIDLPESWLKSFPSGQEIFDHVVRLVPFAGWQRSIDELLLRRRAKEWEVFENIERAHVLPRVSGGFATVSDFIKFAQSVSNRRMSRGGRSLELNLASIFRDCEIHFDAQAVTEDNKKPDFLFPTVLAYRDPGFPALRLNMLAAKTCCKDRWRQVINEADRVGTKHLFTLQEGISENQLREMGSNNVELVVPSPNLKFFPASLQNSIATLDSFVRFIRDQQSATDNIKKWIV